MAAENQDSGNTPQVAVSGGVGSLLRETRQKLGQDLPSVATALRIRQPYLQAIEDGRFEDLPGATYAVGFVRGYAEYLGLDSNEILRRFKQENAEYATRAELVFPAAVSEGSIPTGALLGFAVVAAGIAYGAWYWYQARESSVAEAVPALPERLAALIHRPVSSGSEVVSVAPADAPKAVEPVAGSVTAPAAMPGSPAAPMQMSATQVPAPGAPHEDVVPPAEEDSAATPGVQPTPTPASASPLSAPVASAPPVAAPPVAPVATPAATVDAKPDGKGPDGKGKAGKTKDAKAEAAKRAGDGAAKDAKEVTTAAASADGAAPAKVAEESKPTDTPASPAAGTGEAAKTVAKPAELAAAAVPSASGRDNARVVLRAAENCWIEIRDANGQVIHSRLLHKGETYPVPSRPGLHLTAGNAGALEVLVDGKPTGPLGGLGMVRRDMSLDRDRIGAESQPDAPPTDQPATPAGAPTE